MREKPQNRARLRPIDLARGHGLSTQAVRNYEESGILPAAERTPSGYRAYTPLHAAALRAFLALLPGNGHPTAAAVMRAVNEGAAEEAFRLIDESHARLLEDRGTLVAVENALRDVGPGPGPGAGAGAGYAADPGAAGSCRGDRGSLIGPLAGRLGLRPATLRAWERAGLLRPERDPDTGYRRYPPEAVREALLIRQLRRGGYQLAQIAPLVEQLRAAGGLEPLEGALRSWRRRLAARARALLSGAAALDRYLTVREDSGAGAG